MTTTRGKPAWFSRLLAAGFLAVVGSAVVLTSAAAAGGARDLAALRSQAEQYERVGNWEKACQAYDLLLSLDRRRPEIKARLLHCLRRYYQVYRHRDDSYRREVLTLGYPQALKIYRFVCVSLLDGSIARSEVSPARLFRKGLEELRHALADPVFVQYNLPGASPAEIDAFRAYLEGPAWEAKARTVKQPRQALDLVRDIAMEGLGRIKLNATTVVMEFTCGACYAIDEYTTYLTPTQLRELCDSLKGETVGVGLRLAAQDGWLVVADILPGSPAAEVNPPLVRDDVLAAIDHKAVSGLTPETALALLQGETGTKVEVEIHSAMLGVRHLTLRRRAIFVPSLGPVHLKSPHVGYVQINSFQEGTPQEIDAALAGLKKEGAQALVLDLRGNGGGRFEAAIDVARRFLSAGIIASTQHPDPRQNMVYQARGAASCSWPLVVLIDGDTASAAEVLAGALKGNRRATLVGQPTYGKGCIQGLLRLCPHPGEFYPGGVRLTVARFCSPAGQPYTGRGVEPDHVLDRTTLPPSVDPPENQADNQLEEALEEAQRLLDKGRPGV